MSSKRAIRRKACKSKTRYDSEAAARGAIGSLLRGTGCTDFLTVYRCQFCGGFHFGHPPRRIRQAISAKRAQ